MISVLKNLKRWIEDKQKDSSDMRSYRRDDWTAGQLAAYAEVISRIDEILSVVEYKGEDNG